MAALTLDPAKIRPQLAEEVLNYLHQVASRAAEVPAYYPAHLRSLERGKTKFDEIRQAVQVVEDRELFRKWLAEKKEHRRAAGYIGESLAYSQSAMRPGEQKYGDGFDGIEESTDARGAPPHGEDSFRGSRKRLSSIPDYGLASEPA